MENETENHSIFLLTFRPVSLISELESSGVVTVILPPKPDQVKISLKVERCLIPSDP